jgi:hypothetical protein
VELYGIQERQDFYGAEMNQLSIEDYLKTARYEGPVNADDCARLEGQTLRRGNQWEYRLQRRAT